MPDLDAIAREDLTLFIGAALAATGLDEHYGDAEAQRVSIGFLHDYTLAGYRRLYARCLAAGVNHYNQAEIITRLLAAGAPTDADQRAEEGGLIAEALARLPPQRVYRLFGRLRDARVNNRRTRAVMARWLNARPDPAFDALKYRRHVVGAARHGHLKLPGELGPFLHQGPWSVERWKTPLLETFRRTRYEKAAIFELPFTIAEGVAHRRGVKRKKLLEGMEGQLTRGERARLEQTRLREGADLSALDLGSLPLGRLFAYLLSRPLDERLAEQDRWRAAISTSAERSRRRAHLSLGRVAVVLDRSYSSRGSRQKKNHPLAVALGCDALIRAAAADHRCFPTAPLEDPLLATPSGQTDLARPLLRALAWAPDLIVLLSDGYENAPPGATSEILRIARTKLHIHTPVVHLCMVYDADNYMPRPLGPSVPTVGVRDPEDLPTMLSFARFVAGASTFGELQDWLESRVADLLAGAGEAR